MARRKQKQSLAQTIINKMAEKTGAAIGNAIRDWRTADDRRSVIAKAKDVIEQHSEQLAKRRAALVRQDAYGKPVLDKWHAEINYFIKNHIAPALTSKEEAFLKDEREVIVRMIMERTGNTASTPYASQ